VGEAGGRGPFTLDPRAGGAVDGWAAGFDRRRLRALRRGEIAPDLEIDLHGMTRAEAHRALVGTLRDAIAQQLRCVHIVHGRGARSEAGPVLRDALPEWLAEAPHAARILAFAADETRRGGATYVLLRRAR
jgi:DNA-nicking Smr family endonuclease